jgi:hypothetical protein
MDIQETDSLKKQCPKHQEMGKKDNTSKVYSSIFQISIHESTLDHDQQDKDKTGVDYDKAQHKARKTKSHSERKAQRNFKISSNICLKLETTFTFFEYEYQNQFNLFILINEF